MEAEDVREQVWRAFGEWALHKIDPEWAAARITHEPTRRLVTELGLPLQGPAHYHLTMREDRPWPTVRDFFAAFDPEALETRICTEFGHYLAFANLNGEGIHLDPASGGIYQFIGRHDEVRLIPVNSGVAEFLAFLAEIEVDRGLEPLEALLDSDEEDGEEQYERALRTVLDAIAQGVRGVDPDVFPADLDDDQVIESFWYPWLVETGDDDGAFKAWRWNRKSAEYFVAHGIDDLAEREPRHPVDLSAL